VCFKVSVKTASAQCESACKRFSCGLAESGWERIQKSGAPKVKERLPVSNLTDGLKSVTAEDERVDREY
jgi:hypothetical protein